MDEFQSLVKFAAGPLRGPRGSLTSYAADHVVAEAALFTHWQFGTQKAAAKETPVQGEG